MERSIGLPEIQGKLDAYFGLFKGGNGWSATPHFNHSIFIQTDPKHQSSAGPRVPKCVALHSQKDSGV